MAMLTLSTGLAFAGGLGVGWLFGMRLTARRARQMRAMLVDTLRREMGRPVGVRDEHR